MKTGSDEWIQYVIALAGMLGVAVSSAQAALFAIHARELSRWNRRFNLTRVVTPEAVALKHFVDALAPLPEVRHAGRLLDIGSGGGFPGIPIAVMAPAMSVTLIDAVRKKVSFQTHVIRELKLENVTAHHVRAETLADGGPPLSRFDVVICRALGSPDRVCRLGLPLVAPGGRLVAMQGRVTAGDTAAFDHILSEVAGTHGVGFTMRTRHYRLPQSGDHRCLVVAKRNECQPRRNG